VCVSILLTGIRLHGWNGVLYFSFYKHTLSGKVFYVIYGCAFKAHFIHVTART
jgi:hypothetical protein